MLYDHTRATLESQGEGVLTRDFARLAEIPEVLAPAAPEPEKRVASATVRER